MIPFSCFKQDKSSSRTIKNSHDKIAADLYSYLPMLTYYGCCCKGLILLLPCLQVAAVPEDVGTAGALRAIDHHLTAKDILVDILIVTAFQQGSMFQ